MALYAALLLAVLVTGCAHPISLTPNNLDKIAVGGTEKINRKVGLLISDADRARVVETAGGGGDKVSYQPYRDLELGLYTALSQSFTDVSKVTAATDPKVASQGISYIVTPLISTTSSSPSPFTWPPTVFMIDLSCTIADTGGRTVREFKVQGEGRAEFNEFKSDFSLSAKRATEDALSKLVKALAEATQALR